jgi:hypothetical protein
VLLGPAFRCPVNAVKTWMRGAGSPGPTARLSYEILAEPPSALPSLLHDLDVARALTSRKHPKAKLGRAEWLHSLERYREALR